MRYAGRVMLVSLALAAVACGARGAAPGTAGSRPVTGTLDASASKVSFEAHDALEKIDGTLPVISGVVRFDPLHASHAHALVSLDPSGIDTGNVLRDTNARRALFHVDRYPSIVYRLDQVTLTSALLPVGGTAGFSARGRLTLAGATHLVSTTGTVERGARRLTVDATFPIRLTDFGMKPPRLLFITVADEVNVTIHLVFELASP